jgi:putative N6-adenine-specific DNA methylase
MNTHNSNSQFLVICPPGLEQITYDDILAQKSESKNYELNIITGGIEVESELIHGLELNYHLKSATRILLRLAEFKCRDIPKLFNKLSKLNWKKYIWPNVEFKISCNKSRLFQTNKIEKAAIDSIKKYFQGSHLKKDKLEFFEKYNPSSTIFLRFDKDLLTVSVDTSGERLDKREQSIKFDSIAPIRNSFAYALIKDGLKELDNTEEINFYDPFCGSGTFLNEVRNLSSPILDRNFAFESFTQVNKPPSQLNIFNNIEGSDINNELIKKLKKSNIQCTCLDALEELPLKKNTIVITNPPYGLRVKNTNNERKGFFIKCFIIKALENPNIKLLSVVVPNDFSLPSTIDGYSYKKGIKFKNGGIAVTNHIYLAK